MICQGNGPNQLHAIERESVPVLAELINDEDDDELSEKAFECLEALGPKVIGDLMNYLRLALEKVPTPIARTRSLIVDIYQRRERHIYTKQN